MGRAPCCDKANVKKGPWSPEEDAKLKEYMEKHGTGGNWIALPQKAGLRRCGKSCRLRWLNYLRPNIKHGEFSDEEDKIICSLYASIGSKWSIIAAQLPGRTDNDIKNYWNTKLKKKLMGMISSSQKRPNRASTTTTYLNINRADPELIPFSFLQSSSVSSPYSSSPSTTYNLVSNSLYTTTTTTTTTTTSSFTGGYENIATPSVLLDPISPSNLPIMLKAQDGFLSPTRNYQIREKIITFGGDQASSSSTDGKDAEYDHHGLSSNGENNLDLQSCFDNEANWDQKFILNTPTSTNDDADGFSDDMKHQQNGYHGENPIDYSLEEIKQLISTSFCNNNLNLLFDENTTEEKVLYF